MRAAQDTTGSFSATPIYDALYSEYLKAFRALPGDRTGEEELRFTGFGTGPYGGAQHGTARHDYRQTPRQDPRHDPRHHAFQVARYGQPAQADHHGYGQLFPAALPPGPRRG
ncbi:hypothetical protein [Streptomyces sp. CC224B]|uniref:hypothetical protein n=1 Tax=Streptomyces sp. CC224B TaxID=3044571 RepID=UPI0024A8F9FF|nr:hypothetical protein [Streptomyces sp. CC224B]